MCQINARLRKIVILLIINKLNKLGNILKGVSPRDGKFGKAVYGRQSILIKRAYHTSIGLQTPIKFTCKFLINLMGSQGKILLVIFPPNSGILADFCLKC